ncbi:MAG TPA: hypothetical protein VNC39_03555 [Acidocella sp.]|jgi:hypothetical protein|uniref:hypothetical protein n=1 Tax=Acidocella sp. TaxID=50710 RepID=UPI002CD8DBF1|nr:hypothetical protein [Acidocella sp.]HVE21026.1 hypothetical protein [Acidocella sp.]
MRAAAPLAQKRGKPQKAIYRKKEAKHFVSLRPRRIRRDEPRQRKLWRRFFQQAITIFVGTRLALIRRCFLEAHSPGAGAQPLI